MFLPPANRCFSPTRDSKTSRSAARVARQSGRKAAVEGIRLHAQKQEPTARSAARKLQSLSGQRKVARYFAENASRRGARWEQLRKQFETESWNDQQKGTRNRGVPFCFFNLFPEDFVISRRTRERSRLQISLELSQENALRSRFTGGQTARRAATGRSASTSLTQSMVSQSPAPVISRSTACGQLPAGSPERCSRTPTT